MPIGGLGCAPQPRLAISHKERVDRIQRPFVADSGAVEHHDAGPAEARVDAQLAVVARRATGVGVIRLAVQLAWNQPTLRGSSLPPGPIAGVNSKARLGAER